MSFMEHGFEYDIFISYAHGPVDEETNTLMMRDWARGFYGQLKAELRLDVAFTKTLSIWFDANHGGDDGLKAVGSIGEQLGRNCRSSALMLVLMSDHYLISDWCPKELQAWLETRGRFSGPPLDRIVIVRKWSTTQNWWTELLDSDQQPPLGYCFYDAAEKRPLAWPRPDGSTVGPFRTNLLRLVRDVSRQLHKMKEELAARAAFDNAQKRLGLSAGQTVYLHGRPDYRETWKGLRDDLQSRKLIVLPHEITDPGPDFRKQSRQRELRLETMGGCDAVLLVGTDDPDVTAADLIAVAGRDRETALMRQSRPLPCAVLDRHGSVAGSTAQSDLLRRFGIDIIDAQSDTWNPEVQTWLHANSAGISGRSP